jgi:hypothetical protein
MPIGEQALHRCTTTRADSEEALLGSWLASLLPAHSGRNFEVIARRTSEQPENSLFSLTLRVELLRDGRCRHRAGNRYA